MPGRPRRDGHQYAPAVGARRRADRRPGQRRAGGGRRSGRRARRATAATRARRGCATTPSPPSRRCGAVSACARWPRCPSWWPPHPDGDGGWHARGRPARPARRGRQRRPRGAADARGRRDSRWRAGDPADAGPAGRRTGRGDRADRPLAGRPGVRIVHASGDDGWASPLRLGRRRGRRGPRRRARRGWPAEQAVTSRDSELLAEPHPSREQLFGRPAVDRFARRVPARPPTPATTRRGWIARRGRRSRPRR